MSINNLEKRNVCRACGSDISGEISIPVYSHIKNYTGEFMKCGICQTESVTERIDYAQLYKNRDSTNYPSSSGVLIFLKKHALKFAATKLLKNVPKEVKILDYGCGGGEFGNALSNLGYPNIVASDVQNNRPESLRNEVEYLGIHQLQDSNAFDIIVMRHVIEHLEHPAEIMKSLKNKLNDHGQIIVEFPSEKSAWKRILKGDWPGYFFPFHTMVLSENGARYVFHEAGLEIVEERRVEPPILGTYFISLGIPRGIARILSLLAYPLQFITSKALSGSEAIVFILKKPVNGV